MSADAERRPSVTDEPAFFIGQRVRFWSGRGSQGFATIREIRDGRAFLDPDPDATKGSDYRVFRQPAKRPDGWGPRDYGVPLDQLNTAPRIWWKDL